MNTYNDNLRSIVFDSLQSRETERKKLKSQLKSAKISLYYAQGTRITAEEKLVQDHKELTEKTDVKTQAVKNNSIMTNTLASTDQDTQYMDTAVTNAATCASNVQIAANAVLKLAGNVGSIASIVNAADYGEDIYDSAQDVKKLMDQTAYDAETASRQAMEASAATAEVSYKKMSTQSKVTDDSIKNVLKIADAEFDKASALVATDHDVLATDTDAEKKAEGKIADIGIDYNASKKAYNEINGELNHGLTVSSGTAVGTILEPIFTTASFNVSFTPILSPFSITDKSNKQYPVKEYYVALVKYAKRSTFSISEVETLYSKYQSGSDTKCLTPVTASDYNKDKNKYKVNILCKDVVDSDEEPFSIGEQYVVFLFAVYDDKYKRLLNDFEDYLSAPSSAFTITQKLAGPSAENIAVHTIVSDVTVHETDADGKTTLSAEIQVTEDGKPKGDKTERISWKDDGMRLKPLNKKIEKTDMIMRFTVPLGANGGSKVEYRCMFLPLPDSKNAQKDAYTKKNLTLLEDQVKYYDEVYDRYAKKLIKLQNEIDGIKGEQGDKKQKKSRIAREIEKLEKEEAEIKAMMKSLNSQLKEMEKREAEVESINKQITKLQEKEVQLKEEQEALQKQEQELDGKIVKTLQEMETLEKKIIELESKEKRTPNEEKRLESLFTKLKEQEKLLDDQRRESASTSNKITQIRELENEQKQEIEKLRAKRKELEEGVNVKEVIKEIEQLEKNLADLSKNLEKMIAELEKEEKEEQNATPGWSDQLKEANRKMRETLEQRKKEIEKIEDLIKHDKIAFFFDLDLAELVSPANYTVAKNDKGSLVYTCPINVNTTDNFGSPLVSNDKYLPVVLTVSAEDETILDQYTSTLSKYNKTNSFTYSTKPIATSVSKLKN